jgi:crotonobetainyl-CoA:carnitine CoA-transferase CaiB-like acyl-CoA transferase
VRALNPNTIYCSFSAFGERGPLTGKPGAELVIQAAAEFSASLGEIGDPPERIGSDTANIDTAVHGYQAVLAALFHRLATGEAQKVAVSMFGVLLNMRGLMWAGISNPDEWQGSHCDSYGKPRDFGWRTKDGAIYFRLHRGSEEDYVHLLSALGLLDALDDHRFANGGRDAVATGRYAAEVKPIWERGFASFTTAEAIELVRAHGGEAVPVNDYPALFAHPQFAALDLIHELPSDGGPATKLLKVPWRLSHGQRPPQRPAPALGEDTHLVR